MPANSIRSVTRRRFEDSKLLKYAEENRAIGFFNDLIVKAGCDYLETNRMVMSCYSGLMETLCKTKAQTKDALEFPTLDNQAIKDLVEYIYTCIIVISNENVMNLLAAADHWQMADVVKFCFEFLESVVNNETCFDILNAASMYKNYPFAKKVHDYISEHFDEISQNTNFKSLSKPILYFCLENLDRNIVDEMLLFDAIVNWIKYDKPERLKYFPELFNMVNLEKFTKDYLTSVVAEEELIKTNLECSNKVLEILNKLLKDKDRLECGTRIISVGGHHTPTMVAQIYNIFSELPKTFPDLPIRIEFHATLNLDDVIYCIGGKTVDADEAAIDDVWQLNLNADESLWTSTGWTKVTPMCLKRHGMGATVYKDMLVVAGGFDNEYNLNAVEVYKKQTNLWRMASPLIQGRSGNALVACEDSLYVLGGYDGDGNFLSSVERLAGLKSKWEFFDAMKTPRLNLAAVCCKGAIYAIGGRTGTQDYSRLKSVEKYCFSGKRWMYVSEMNFERSALAACVVQGKIFVVGGLDSKNRVVNEIECYDPTQDLWTVVGKTKFDFLHNSVFVF